MARGTLKIASRKCACARTQIVGNYEVTGMLSPGKYDCLYVGKHRHLGTRATIRLVYPSSNKVAAQRLVKEARTIGQITHPNILGVKDCGTTSAGIVYVVMGYQEGESIEDIIAKGQRSTIWCLDVVSQMAEAMAAMHGAGLNHGQLGPSSFRLVEDFPTDRVVLTDFGLASGKSNKDLSPDYMSPEQCKQSSVTTQSDVYSLGCILYELITGEKLFSGTRRKVLKSHQRSTRPDPRKFRPALRPKVALLLEQMLAIDPSKRPKNMSEVAARLGHLRFATGTNPGDILGMAATVPLPSIGNKPKAVLSRLTLVLIAMTILIVGFIHFGLP